MPILIGFDKGEEDTRGTSNHNISRFPPGELKSTNHMKGKMVHKSDNNKNVKKTRKKKEKYRKYLVLSKSLPAKAGIRVQIATLREWAISLSML